MNKKILIDLDETVFAFAHSWSIWMEETTGQQIDEALYWYYDIEMYIPDFLTEQEKFISHLKHIKPKPIPDALEALTILSQHYHIEALTARNKDQWSKETEFWVTKHLPFVNDIHYTRDKIGVPARIKGDVAHELKAHALIDDTKHWIETLPAHIKGYLVRRPHNFASDAGALTWEQIKTHLLEG